MKKQWIAACLSLLIIFICLFAACTGDTPSPSTPQQNTNHVPSTNNTDYQAKIKELENKILALQENQALSDTEYQKKMSALLEELETLKAKAEKPDEDTTKDEATTQDPTQTPTTSRFLYSVRDGKAIITGYTGTEERIVIPSAIDGYPVHEIADNAFESSTLKSVTISNEISRIGWFAFQACPKLESVTVPSSVTGIGYSAFPSDSKVFTLYCHADSFALSYAKSYGLRYTVI